MMTRLILLCFVFIFMDEVQAQNEKSFSAGLIFSPTISASTVIHSSASVFVRSNKSEFTFGIDFYLNKIRGFECGYQQHWLNDAKKNHWYGEINFRGVEYASGYSENGSVDYFDPLSICNEEMVHLNSFLMGYLGFGRELFLSKIFHFNISIGGGAYWMRKELLECWKAAYGYRSEEGIHPEVVLKVGLEINVYRK